MNPMKTIIALAFLIFISSCRKDPSIANLENDVISCPCNLLQDMGIDFPKDSGTYWVYQTYLINSLGEESATAKIDTVWALGKKTLPDGIEYNLNAHNFFGFHVEYVWRDSCGFMVNEYLNSDLFELGLFLWRHDLHSIQ